MGRDLTQVERAFNARDYPTLFGLSADLIGMPRLLQHLRGVLDSHRDARPKDDIYDHIARWPIPVYMTTNYDHEIHWHLAATGEASYIEYSNSEDHLSFLLPDTAGAIVHLHGDLRSEAGLVLTAKQYRNIASGPEWEHWRTKLTSIFQMNPVIVVGHSLMDPHVRHVLEAAKKGAGVAQPVCWIAPDVHPTIVREYLEKYRIRVVSYDNRDGTHRNLARLVEQISDFVPPRLSIHRAAANERASGSPLGTSAGAPGFFVFTKLSAQTDFEEKRISVMVAALRAAVPRLLELPSFSVQQALEISGWPPSLSVPSELATRVAAQSVSDGLLIAQGSNFKVGPNAQSLAKVDHDGFQHLRNRFQTSIANRLRREFESLSDAEVKEVAVDIDAALTGYFREGGLTLASTLAAASQGAPLTLPSSVLRFLNEASAKYDDYLRRQAFAAVSLQAFIRADSAEREYLGRVSQGFFAFHLLGVFGDAARERLRHAKETLWIIDSSAQIAATATGSAANGVFREAFQGLSKLGVRLFTLERLFDETREHLWFADHIVKEYGVSSPSVLASAMGDAPYRQSNLYLEGFVNWQAAGNPADWEHYLAVMSGDSTTNLDAVRSAVRSVPIEPIEFQDWPGFTQDDHAEASAFTENIVDAGTRTSTGARPRDDHADLYKKATPEAEALVVVLHERDGKYRMLSAANESSNAWFISQTAILNSICSGPKITWHPEAFIRFASTLAPASDQNAADRAFEVLLWSLAESGVTVLDERVAAGVFGGVIDEAKLNIREQHKVYEEVLGTKYGKSLEEVLDRVPPVHQPLAALQLANERAARESELRGQAQTAAAEAVKRAAAAEDELSTLQRYRRKLLEKQNEGKRRKRKALSKRKKKH
jgi:SIR2-like domain